MEYFVTKLSTIQAKKKMRVLVEGRPILLACTKNGVFAIRDKCPHMGAILSNGMYEDGIIRCKDHKLPINVETGQVSDMEKADFLRLDEYSRSVSTYMVVVKEESVYIDL